MKTDPYAIKPVRAMLYILALLMAVFTVLLVLRAVFGWGDKAAEVVSADNVSTQHTQIIGTYQTIQQGVAAACNASKGGGGASAGDPVVLEDPATAYGATVRRQIADYNRRMANIFEAGAVGAPSGYPKSITAPATDQEWCTWTLPAVTR